MTTRDNFERFRSVVLDELEIQARLRTLADKTVFIQSVVAEGQLCGCEFSENDVAQAMQDIRREWMERWI